jgi:hypothetical protein
MKSKVDLSHTLGRTLAKIGHSVKERSFTDDHKFCNVRPRNTTAAAGRMSHFAEPQAPEAQTDGLGQGNGGEERFASGPPTHGGKRAAVDLI